MPQYQTKLWVLIRELTLRLRYLTDRNDMIMIEPQVRVKRHVAKAQDGVTARGSMPVGAVATEDFGQVMGDTPAMRPGAFGITWTRRCRGNAFPLWLKPVGSIGECAGWSPRMTRRAKKIVIHSGNSQTSDVSDLTRRKCSSSFILSI